MKPIFKTVLGALMALVVIDDSTALAQGVDVTISTPMAPPNWALLERELIRAQEELCVAYFDKYFDERGYLECVERWGGDDGPDDAIECVADHRHPIGK